MSGLTRGTIIADGAFNSTSFVLASSGATQVVPLVGFTTAVVNITSFSSGNLVIEVTTNGGSTWTGLAAFLVSASGAAVNPPVAPAASWSFATAVPPASLVVSVAGYEQFRVRRSGGAGPIAGYILLGGGVAPTSYLQAVNVASFTGATATNPDPAALALVVRNIPATYTAALEFDVNKNPIYVGYAPQGSLKSDAVWQIRKLTFDGNNSMTDMQFANGSALYNAVWNDRAALSYS